MSKWYIRTRNNASLLTVDSEISDYERFGAVLKWNNMGTWALQLRAESRYAGSFQPDSNGGLPNGIIVNVDNEDGAGVKQVLSGPQRGYKEVLQEDGTHLIQASGYTDEYWLFKRRAYQAPGFGYTTFWPHVTGVKRFYTCGEASGTVANDISGNAQNATYVGGVTPGQPGLIDDPSSCVLLNGTTGYLTVNSGLGLNTGNNTWLMFGWFMATSFSGGNRNALSFGMTPTTSKETVSLYADANGFPHIFCSGGSDVAGATTIPLNQPVLLALMYDGTNLTGWLNGNQFATQNPSPLNIVINAINYGAYVDGTGTWAGYMGQAGFSNSVFNTNPTNQLSGMYATGISRQTFASYDSYTQAMAGSSPVTASTGLIYYVQRNASAIAAPYASFDHCYPTAAFTNWRGTQSARQIPNLSIASDPLVGSQIYTAARQDNLLYYLAALALKSAPEIGFSLQQVNQQLVFSTFLPRDMTASAVFDITRGNVRSFTWDYEAAQGNHIIAGGQNASTTLTNRPYQVGEDVTSISRFGYLEDYVDARSFNDPNALQNAVNGQLAAEAAIRNLNVTLNDSPALYFMGPGQKGYQLGDKVTVRAGGQTVTDLIRQVQIDLQPGQPATVTPAIGTPIAAEIVSEYDQLNQNLQALQTQGSILSSNY